MLLLNPLCKTNTHIKNLPSLPEESLQCKWLSTFKAWKAFPKSQALWQVLRKQRLPIHEPFLHSLLAQLEQTLPCHKAKHLPSSTYWQKGHFRVLIPGSSHVLQASLPAFLPLSVANCQSTHICPVQCTQHLTNIYREIKNCMCNFEVIDVFLCSLR